MRRRLRFAGAVLTHAQPFSWGLLGGVLNVLALLALLGLLAADAVPPRWVVAGLCVLVLVGLAEGAYRTWDEVERALPAAAPLTRREALADRLADELEQLAELQ